MSIATDLQTIANNVPLVYNAGVEAGKAQGGGGGDTSEVIAQFTETIQTSAKMLGSDYNYAFYKSPLAEETFSQIMQAWGSSKVISRSEFMFSQAPNVGEALYTDKLDLSKARTAREMFSSSGVTKLKTIDLRKAESGFNGMANVFGDCGNLVSIDEFYPSTLVNFSGTFVSCYALKTVIFKSVISVSGLDIRHSQSLNKESIESIINNLSSTTSGLTVTLSLIAVNRAFETSTGAQDGSTSAEWTTLTGTKTNWTIAYA